MSNQLSSYLLGFRDFCFLRLSLSFAWVLQRESSQFNLNSGVRNCWWLKSCTTWDVWNPINNGINYLSTGAGFQPSTEGLIIHPEIALLALLDTQTVDICWFVDLIALLKNQLKMDGNGETMKQPFPRKEDFHCYCYLEPQGQPVKNGWKWWFPTISYVKIWWKSSNW